MSEITWLGHSAFKITCDDVTVLIDPFLDGNPTCPVSASAIGPVDMVLLTHDHGDHVGQTVQICQSTGAMLGAVVGTAEALVQAGLPAAQVLNGIGFNMGGTLEHKGVHATMTPAFHTSESGLPAGYIVRMPDGLTIYHAGDTCLFGDMALWGTLYAIDVALLPIGGLFTMDARQAATACMLLKPRQVIPMHWGTFPVLAQSTCAFKQELAALAPDCQCADIQPGQTLSL